MMAPDKPEPKAERPKEVLHDETPSGIVDHAFEPKGEWYTLCKHCNFAESAHAETMVDHKTRIQIEYYSETPVESKDEPVLIRYHSDDNPEV